MWTFTVDLCTVCWGFQKNCIRLGKFTPRGGISIDPYCNYGKPGTPWADVAFNRLTNHDLYPEKIDNR